MQVLILLGLCIRVCLVKYLVVILKLSVGHGSSNAFGLTFFLAVNLLVAHIVIRVNIGEIVLESC